MGVEDTGDLQERPRCAWQVEDWIDGPPRQCRRTGVWEAGAPRLWLCEQHHESLRRWWALSEEDRLFFSATQTLCQRAAADIAKADDELADLKAKLAETRREIRKTKASLARAMRVGVSRIDSPATYIYVIRRFSDGAIKIGYTAHLENRLGSHYSEQGPLEVLRVLTGTRRQESVLHIRFRRFLVDGREWYRLADPITRWIESLPPLPAIGSAS